MAGAVGRIGRRFTCNFYSIRLCATHAEAHSRAASLRALVSTVGAARWSVACSWPVSVWGSSSGNSSEPQAERLTTASAPPLRTLSTRYACSFARAPSRRSDLAFGGALPGARERSARGAQNCAKEAQVGAVRAQRWRIHASTQACASAQPRSIPRFASSTG